MIDSDTLVKIRGLILSGPHDSKFYADMVSLNRQLYGDHEIPQRRYLTWYTCIEMSELTHLLQVVLQSPVNELKADLKSMCNMCEYRLYRKVNRYCNHAHTHYTPRKEDHGRNGAHEGSEKTVV